ncbi:DET1- and DDB1-associated protein 1-like isoform X2 [Tachypleus tridentatus]|uniref:DET1- and DDB1-associated protein 1-like isoform X2 n=1 Tax=Tachypleus tridentatus TaxID=6853 RepID=UPI003FD30BA4
MSIAEFLKELPSHNESNFSRFQADTSSKTTVKRPAVYLPTKDHPAEQINLCYSNNNREDEHSSKIFTPTMGQEELFKKARLWSYCKWHCG